jgi:uncharacterized membrane protein YccC
MDWPRGLRAGTALCVPLLAVDITGVSGLAWTALGGFEAIIADSGGPYRTRLGKLAVISLGGGLGCAIGTLAGGDVRWAVPVTALFCFIWSYLAVLGSPFTPAGVLVQVIYFCGLGAPDPSWRTACIRGLFVLAGGLWAITFSLVLWPFDPYRPARRAVSDCYAALASFLTSVTELHDREHVRPALWHRLARHHQKRSRQTLETAWQSVASVRAESLAETAQSSYMVVLLETADMVLARTVALAEHLESTSAHHPQDNQAQSIRTPCSLRSQTALSDLRSAEEWVANLLRRRAETSDAAARSTIDRRRAALAELPVTLRACLSDEDPDGQFLLSQVAEALSLLETAVECAVALRFGDSDNLPLGAGGAHVRARINQLRETMPLSLLRSNFTRESLLLRHAIRAAIVCGLDVVLVHLLHVDHGYWLLLTSVIVLQPHVGGTLRRGMERVGGTVGGGILAALLAVTVRSPLAIAIALFPLAVLALAFMPVSYAVFAFFLTPTFVLAYLPHPGDWQLATIRVGDTVMGAALSLTAMALLFPSFERDRIAKYLLASLEANLRYLELLTESWKTEDPASRALAQARRATGLAHNATEESLERVLTESWSRKASGAEATLAVTAYLRRFAQSITTLATLDGEWEWKQSPSVEARLTNLGQRLRALDEEVRCATLLSSAQDGDSLPAEAAISSNDAESTPVSEGESTEVAENGLGERQLVRMERQVTVLHRQILSMRQHRWLRCP